MKKCRIESGTTATAMMYLINMPSDSKVILEYNDVFTKPTTIFSGPDTWTLRIGYNKGLLGENSGQAIFSGDGTTTQFTIAHGLVGTPSKVVVTPCSADAAGSFYVTVDSTNIYVNYSTAPASGTNNICLYWEAEV